MMLWRFLSCFNLISLTVLSTHQIDIGNKGWAFADALLAALALFWLIHDLTD